MQSSSQQLSFDDFAAGNPGAMLRDIGIAEAEFAEALTGSDFAEVAYAAICHVARRQSEVHVDDLIRFLKVKPSHPNCMGAIWIADAESSSSFGSLFAGIEEKTG
jgi:hypothetical protein